MWRKRMQDLARAVGRPHAPLFAPMLFGIAAQIEAIDPQAMAHDATRLRKNVGELRRMIGGDTVFCSVPSDAEVELARRTGEDMAPALVATQPRLAVALEAIRQWQADSSEPVIVAALRGPASLVQALRVGDGAEGAEGLFERAGRTLAGVARVFCEAGVHVLQWCETGPPVHAEFDWWKDALGTAGNVARFHRVAPVLSVQAPAVATWPPQAVACPSSEQHAGAMVRPHGRTWHADPAHWPMLPGESGSERIVLTSGEVAAETDISHLLDQVRRVRGY